MSKQNRSPSTLSQGAAASEGRALSRSATRWLAGLTVVAIGFWVLLGLHVLPLSDDRAGDPNADVGSSTGVRATHSTDAETGQAPWGRLTYVPITISPPLELVPHMMPPTGERVAWHFPDTISERLPALLSEIGLSEPLREKLVSLAEPNRAVEGVTIHPPLEIVLGLSPEDRSALYVTLAGFPENSNARGVFRFCGGALNEWIGDSPISPETRKLVEPLIYRHGNVLFFSDLGPIEGSLPSSQQRSLLVEALSHESTFLLRLELSEESKLEELVDYWGHGGRTKEVRPILESLFHSEGARSIDIVHLLPPFARGRLYTYHVNSGGKLRHHFDCHWTAMNFFSEQPDDRFGDVRVVARALEEQYRQIQGSLGLGDVVVFLDGQTVIHSAVFIAADVLFTKNGRGSQHPWMLMTLENMQDYYPRQKRLQPRYYRRKDF